MAEYHDRVARFNLRVARNEHSLLATHQSADGHADGHSQVLDRFLGYLGSFFGDELRHVGVGIHEKAHVHHVGVEHHLIDVAGGNHLLVDDGSDVEALSHAHVVDVLYGSHGLSHSHALGCEACQDIGLCVSRQRHESLRAAYSLLVEQRDVASVAMDDECLVLVEYFVEVLTPCLVLLDDFALHVFGHFLHGSHGRASSAHNHHVLYVHIVLLAHYFSDVGNIVASGHEVSQVVEFQLVVTAGDDGFVASLDGHYVVGVVGSADVLERLVQYLAGLSQLDAEHYQGTVVHVPSLSHPTHLQSVVDVDSGEHLWIYQLADAQSLEELLCLRIHVFGVVHACHRSLGSQVFRQDAGSDIGALQWRDSDEEVGISRSRIAQYLQACRLSHHGEQVAVGADACQPLLALVDECYLLVAA